MHKHSDHTYRIVHVFGEYINSTRSINDELCLIENADGHKIAEATELNFWRRFVDEAHFEEHLKGNPSSESSDFIISSYYELDRHLQKIWWHYDSQTFLKKLSTKHFYRTRSGTIGSKISGALSPANSQSISNDGSIFVRWASGGHLITSTIVSTPRGTLSIKPTSIEDLNYAEPVVFCSCPFCGNIESSTIDVKTVFLCCNCHKSWSIRPQA